MGRMQIVPLLEIFRESHHTMTYRFRADFGGSPGQFIMVWIPRHDELPMALSYLGPVKGITVHAHGEDTKALQTFQPGDRVGVRGPYGNTFRLEGEKILAVAGGTGMASMIAAIEAFAHQGAQVTTAVGARTSEELLFVDRASASGEMHVSTDDGSRGFHGLVPALAEKLLDKHKFDQVVTCGPERMMKMVLDAAVKRGLPIQVSLERYMKCGIGICDACAFDDRLVCVDGPVFTSAQLAGSRDFGHFRRTKEGRRTSI
jgi:dihydroorotate dehydrogenase electron transfer subunit